MMNRLTYFQVGEHYTNDQIRFSLDLENLGGIRPSVDARGNVKHLAVLTADVDSGKLRIENPYCDRIEQDVLVYTAQGKAGDQNISGRNKRLIEQYSVPIPFFGFSNIGKQTYRFLGLLELLRHYQETQPDIQGQLRKVWLFEFRIHENPNVIPIDEARVIAAALLEQSRNATANSNLDRELGNVTETAATEPMSFNPEVELLRARLMTVQPYRFEHLIKTLMEYSGFRDVSVTPASADGGIDIDAFVEKETDFFAVTHVQAQVKRWRHAVGSVEINGFRGALSSTAKGIFITTSAFTRAAVAEARHDSKPCISLIEGTRLASLFIEKGISRVAAAASNEGDR